MMDIVLYSDDINLIDYWKKAFESVTIVDDIEELYKLEPSIVLMDYASLESGVASFLDTLKEHNHRVLVLHRTPKLITAKTVLRYGAYGYGNALMRLNFLQYATEVIDDGLVWLHPEFTSALIMQIPQTQEQSLDEKLQLLSKREKEVALLLKDGDTYKVIAQKLLITPRTVKAHANNIYKKLDVKNRLALALYLR